MQLLIKWYVARNAPGPEDLTVYQEWHLFLVIFFNLFGYDVSKLHATKTSDLENTCKHHSSPDIVTKKPKTTNNGSPNDWLYIIKSEFTNQVNIFTSNALGLCKVNTNNTAFDAASVESGNVKMTNNVQFTFTSHLPVILFSLHLLYEEIKLNCNMSENSILLAKLLHQISIDLKLKTYQQHYANDFSILYQTNFTSQFNKLDLSKIIIPNYLTSDTPNISKAMYDLLTYSHTASYPYLHGVNKKSKDLIKLLNILSQQDNECILELDHHFKPINCEKIGKLGHSMIVKNEHKKIEDFTHLCYDSGNT